MPCICSDDAIKFDSGGYTNRSIAGAARLPAASCNATQATRTREAGTAEATNDPAA
jgi:hypothetical protein